jgi:LytR cell envelope-related transcriptional attenuator
VRLIQEIGSYAGLAAIPGLAILSALYFSQARDVRRLREWAGRAPERSAEQAQGGRVVARPAPQTAAAQQQPAAAAGAAAQAAAAGGGGTATATRPATAAPPGTHPPVPRVHTGGQTTILGAGASANGQDPWYRRAADRLPAARYIAIALVGILVVGGGIAFGLTQIGGSGSGSKSASSGGNVGAKQGKKAKSAPAAISPRDVSVAVLNGTTTNFLASTYGRKLQAFGFNVGNEANANQGQVNETVVLFKPGKSREAALVRRKLGVTQIEPADQTAVSQGGGADVIVVLGADLAQSGTP